MGTYGMASAQLYWGRMAALLLRITYYAFLGLCLRGRLPLAPPQGAGTTPRDGHPPPPSGHGDTAQLEEDGVVFEQHMAGVPGGPTRGPVITMAKEKHQIVMELLRRLAEGEAFSSKAIEKALGRLPWATAACPMTRVFSQPFACRTAGKPPKLVRMLAVLLSALWGTRYTQFSPFTPVSKWWGQ